MWAFFSFLIQYKSRICIGFHFLISCLLLKAQKGCQDDVAVLGKFCAEVITSNCFYIRPIKNALVEL